MNVVIELGPADLSNLASGMAVGRAGIVVVPVGHPLIASLGGGQLLVLDDGMRQLVNDTTGRIRMRLTSGEYVDLIRRDR